MTKFFGILNITPDSFSDGGNYNSIISALDQTKVLIEQNCDIIDIGAESTRPGAVAITSQDEIKRLSPIVENIAEYIKNYNIEFKRNIHISLDSRHYETIRKYIDIIDIINDVSGLVDERIIEIGKKFNKKLVLMHNLGVPSDPNHTISRNENIIELIKQWLDRRLQILKKYSFCRDQIIFDPGLGFGKCDQHNIDIINNIEEFDKYNMDILVGHSKKRFLDIFEHPDLLKNSSREEKTKFISNLLINKNISYLRIHNIL